MGVLAENGAAPSVGNEREKLPLFDGATLGHAFASELPELAVPWRAAPAPQPEIAVLNTELAVQLGLIPAALDSREGAEFLVGNALAHGSEPVAQLYAGHQFGGYSPMLGDGRALLLGELRTPSGDTLDLHLKGSGRTPPARGDGYAALGPMLREYLVSESMHALGVPTTRALAVVRTGRTVRRDDFLHDGSLPGAVLARTAASHLRVGTFQLARARGDIGLLTRLVDFAIRRHYPQLRGDDRSALGLYREVIRTQASLTALWMLVGFVHGVMNTDNVTISGETIDYGPCAFIDAYDPTAVFSSIDHGGRYGFGAQPSVAKWNLARFGEALLPLLDNEDRGTARAVELAQSELAQFERHFSRVWVDGMRAKLGLPDTLDDAVVGQLADKLLGLLTAGKVDYTSAFRALTDAAGPHVTTLGSAGPCTTAGDIDLAPNDISVAAEKDPVTRALLLLSGVVGTHREQAEGWFEDWLGHRPQQESMLAANPVYIPRNHLLAETLDAATDGDLAPFLELLAAVRSPHKVRDEWERFANPAPPQAGRFVSTCGT